MFLLSFSCSLRFLSRGSEFLFGAVLAAPFGAPKVSWGPLWGPLCAARGAQKGPPNRRDSLFWGLTGVLWGARWGLARFLPFLLAHGEYSNVSASSLQNSGEYSKVVFVCLFVFVCFFVCVFVRFAKSAEVFECFR